jgi:LmbE family N-acetylglucosaminyl deacetylase
MKTAPLLDAYDWEQLERVIILSPHLDDAALSCGGLLAALPPSVPRTVVTLCCGNPVPRAPEGVLETQGKHAQRGRNRKGFATPEERRTEDRAALASVHADCIQLGFADAVYRRSAVTGELISERPRQTWAGPSMDDQSYVEELYLLLRRLCVNVGRVLLVSPLGIGHHVDHVITAQTALRLSAKVSRLLFYEDFPYVVDLQKGDGNGDPLAAMARLGMEPSARLWLPIDAEKKARLVEHYATQIPALFGEAPRIREAIERRRFQGAPVELYWRLRASASKGASPNETQEAG